ncbi:unnamed protein product [Prorocentrum cordatum]|uniref:Uncharacterized protein n=1 Tax=Prorocentrum cordatum TaxID=2364126 RepID=A0ABN9UX32_9DINO|nr:unnamed protein product [Polarella glacialis]
MGLQGGPLRWDQSLWLALAWTSSTYLVVPRGPLPTTTVSPALPPTSGGDPLLPPLLHRADPPLGDRPAAPGAGPPGIRGRGTARGGERRWRLPPRQQQEAAGSPTWR